MVDPLPPTSRPQKPPLSAASTVFRLAGIAVVVAAAAGIFAYVGGYFDPQRLTPKLFTDRLEQSNGIHPGFRRNHSKGVCVAGYFESNGAAAEFSSAQVLSATRTPVVGRFALPTGNPYSPDSAAPIRSMALRFKQANGQQWRTGMNSMPVFPVGTPEAFYGLLTATAPDPATGKPDPSKPPAFFAAHPEAGPFLAWVKTAKPSASYTTEQYNSLNAFYLVGADGKRQAVRWSMVPVDKDEPGAQAPEAKDYLEKDLDQHLASGPLRWDLIFTLANAGDPINDASKSWSADHRTVNAGTLVLESTQPQLNGDCRDVNYDPLVLPSGIEGSDDPLLAARSAVYASSYLRRTREVDQLPTSASTQESK
ncbi:catalase family peroxidase [Pseudomonas sp. CCI3.2]|uniref:catalase family peroxidase n=1 Tax=unclassified Pseudomonas TaxID=196821 RepID=UPI002AC924F3|nr:MULTISPECIES: catalase family peroxidase [unclassified Pseudomonas]MEB0079550.1 catalase family peroxidase [Pseudomonas sp. MH10out]MEB0091341.1 catalase family peroxidase [Pseudomonas sp. CCI4.2]MEB0101215.1 catalase family peroxidase [Pseudomonas sp. CCI3.2]MEB0131322.1 catalase family peroxidase [Pseudomonas sp. CCI2.4]MEB0159277.1 catalase family peroxidase [Pseudomonas sp. AH2 (2023)]